MSKLIFTSLCFRDKSIRLSALLDGSGRPLLFDVPGDTPAILGNIYVGRVNSIVPQINAAFVEYAPGCRAFFSLEEPEGIFVKRASDKKLSAGDELLVEITKEAEGTKDATCSSVLTFKDELLFISSPGHGRGISKKITDPEKRRYLKEWADSKQTEANMVVRTQAVLAGTKALEKSYDTLVSEFESIREKAPHLTAGSVLRRYTSDELYLARTVRPDEIEEAVTDDKKLFDLLNGAGLSFPIRLYSDSLPLAKVYSLETRLEEALAKKVYLKSGGWLYIEPTEALTVIDVNSGKVNRPGSSKGANGHDHSGDKEKASLEVNIEAAKEIVRQLMLRNISGIVVVDFINMKNEGNRKRLIREFEGFCKNDTAGTAVMGLTRLGLCELTRKKTKKTLYSQIFD